MCMGGKPPDMPNMPAPPKPPPPPTKPAMVLKKKKKPGGGQRVAGDTASLRIPKGISAPAKRSGLSIPTYS